MRARAVLQKLAAARRPPAAPAPARYDDWLALAHDELAPLEAAVRATPPGEAVDLRAFGEVDEDAWGLLLTQQQERYPAIRGVLPDVPDPSLQELWNGASGMVLAAQSGAFYRRVRQRFAEHGPVALPDARVLDFGCGWGRLTRWFARDVAPGRLHGCDPVETILDVCRRTRVPAVLTQTDFVPQSLPYEEPFDLAFAFSVFTHTSERSTQACLEALGGVVRPGGLLVATIRPASYLPLSPLTAPLAATLPAGWTDEARHVFVPHAAEPSHLQYEGGEMHYGEAVITLAQVRERWAPTWELLDVDLTLADPYQVVLTLRRSGSDA